MGKDTCSLCNQSLAATQPKARPCVRCGVLISEKYCLVMVGFSPAKLRVCKPCGLVISGEHGGFVVEEGDD